jgi:amino-acid N-acetyltransferase
MTIRDARPEDLEAVSGLLRGASLPTAGVERHFENFLVADEPGDGVVGAIGLELYGDTALLRSAVVAPEQRCRGIGARLYDALIARAGTLKVRRVLLLTNTAEGYFRKRGFKTIDQAGVTGPVTTSVEFSGACPSHAVCMELEL